MNIFLNNNVLLSIWESIFITMLTSRFINSLCFASIEATLVMGGSHSVDVGQVVKELVWGHPQYINIIMSNIL